MVKQAFCQSGYLFDIFNIILWMSAPNILGFTEDETFFSFIF